MTKPLRVLIVEDSEDDAALLIRELNKVGYELTHRRVWTAEELELAYAEGPWDIVISDWSMPRFNGLAAYRQIRAKDLDVPFIIVSGTVGEEVAVEALKAGVHDFMSKGKFARLMPAIERELREADVRRRRREAESELVRKRQEIERAASLLRQVLESVPDGVAVVDETGRFVLWNPAADIIVKMGMTDLNDPSWPLRFGVFLPDKVTPFPPDDAALLRALAGQAVDSQEMYVRGQGALQGTWLSIDARPLRGERNEITGAVAVFRDITHEKSSQEQLMIADRMASIGMLAAGVGHEINNPLAAVIANVDLALQDVESVGNEPLKDVGELRAMLTDARHAAERVRQIVRDLKSFSRHQEGQPTAVDIHRVLDSSLRMAQGEIRHRAQVSTTYGADVPQVLGSEPRLSQVFLNLIVNAAQAIPPGNAERNTIRIRTRLTSEELVCVEVEDTGEGMSPEVLRNLFTPFLTTKPVGVGTGLGLVICQRIVTEHRGLIQAESEAGRGTTFRVLLPRATGSERSAPVVSSVKTEVAARRARILVVDDEPLIGTVIKRALGSEHEVVMTTAGSEALARLGQNERYDLIFCDLMMPHMTGMEFYAAVRALSSENAERIVFLTGGTFTPKAQSFLESVTNQRIEKPFDALSLRTFVNNHLKAREPVGEA